MHLPLQFIHPAQTAHRQHHDGNQGDDRQHRKPADAGIFGMIGDEPAEKLGRDEKDGAGAQRSCGEFGKIFFRLRSRGDMGTSMSSTLDIMLIASAAAIVIVGAALVAKGYPRGSWVRIALALVQGIATAVVILLPVWNLRYLDELQRRIQLEALAFAFLGTAVLGVGYGSLQNAGLPQIEWGGAHLAGDGGAVG